MTSTSHSVTVPELFGTPVGRGGGPHPKPTAGVPGREHEANEPKISNCLRKRLGMSVTCVYHY